MTNCFGLGPYSQAFALVDAPFLEFFDYQGPGGSAVLVRSWTRQLFLTAAWRAASLIQASLKANERQGHAFSANEDLDLVWRLGARLAGTTPVTLNWQADSEETMAYKLQDSGCKLLVIGTGFDLELALKLSQRADCDLVAAAEVLSEQTNPMNMKFMAHKPVDIHYPQMIVYTSGTTGHPKGVLLSGKAYGANAEIFEKFLQIGKDPLTLIVVNPLHHTNATAMCDWAMRRPGAKIQLVSRYATAFWPLFFKLAQQNPARLVVNLVSRHFDFWQELVLRETFADLAWMQSAAHRHELLAKVDFLLGSAPVGPATVAQVMELSGKPPLVRFGSTECCLQLIGTPRDDANAMASFRAGWEREARGFYIGRPHPPWTEIRLVRAIDPHSEDFLKDCEEGELGYFVCISESLMSGYCGQTRDEALWHEDWYLGLRDMGFWLKDVHDLKPNYYWCNRDSALLIRGGANYSYDQIAETLRGCLIREAAWPEKGLSLAVVGLRKLSEHEDSCCLLIEAETLPANFTASEGEKQLLLWLQAHAPKWARPNELRLGKIPRNFKGAILTKELRYFFEA